MELQSSHWLYTAGRTLLRVRPQPLLHDTTGGEMDLNRSCEPELCLMCYPHHPSSTGTTLGQQRQKGSDASLAGSSLAELPPPYERAINKATSAHTLLNLHSSSRVSQEQREIDFTQLSLQILAPNRRPELLQSITGVTLQSTLMVCA